MTSVFTPLGASRSGKASGTRRRLALLAACVLALALGAEQAQAAGHLQSQSGGDGSAQAQVVPVQVSAGSTRAAATVDAPVRVLSPGNDGRRPAASRGRAAAASPSQAQSQSAGDRSTQAQVLPLQVATGNARASLRASAPIRVLSPGDDGRPKTALPSGAETSRTAAGPAAPFSARRPEGGSPRPRPVGRARV
jgi:hypothetical protein